MSPPRQSRDGDDAAVGPVLLRGLVGEAVLAAIREHNSQIQVIDRGAYLRVLVPGRCRLSRAAVEAQLGGAFQLPADLEEVMPSFKGTLTIGDDEVIWQARRRP